MSSLLTIIAMLLVANIASAVDYTTRNPAGKIDNPAAKISNPANKIYNPATNINNPATVIENPAGQMTNPDPLHPPTQPVVTRKGPVPPEAVKPVTPVVQKKYYTFKRVKDYIIAAKKAFVKDDYREFIAITEDAQRRIIAGSLKASVKTSKKLEKYKAFGYSLLTEDEE